MANKVNMLKLLQEIRGFSQVTYRRPPPRSPGLFLMQLRAQATQKIPPRRRLNIAVEIREPGDAPRPIRITHVQENAIPIIVPGIAGA